MAERRELLMESNVLTLSHPALLRQKSYRASLAGTPISLMGVRPHELSF